MNIEYTENTKYVEDIVRKYITDPEDCDTVIWCLQKMHIDIDSLVAMLSYHLFVQHRRYHNKLYI